MEFIKLLWGYWAKPILYFYRKKIAAVIAVIALILWMGTAWKLFRLPFSSIKAFEAISDRTAVVFETSQYTQLLNDWSNKVYYNGLQGITIVHQWERGLKLIDSLLKTTEQYRTTFEQAHVVSGLQLIGNANTDWLYAFEKYEGRFDIEQFIHEVMPQEQSMSMFRGVAIYTLKTDQRQSLSIAMMDGVVLMSPSTILVESSIERLDNIDGNLFTTKGFKKAQQQVAIDGGTLVVYTSFENFPSLTNSLVKQDVRLVEQLSALGNWMGMDVRFLNEGFIFSGHIEPQDKFLKALTQQKAPKNSTIVKYLPSSMGAMLYFGWDNFEALYQGYQSKIYKDFETYFKPWMAKDMALVYKTPIDTVINIEQDILVLMQTKDASEAEVLLRRYAYQFGELKKTSYQNFEIVQLAMNDVLEPIFGASFNLLQNPYYLVINDYVLLANSEAVLMDWVRDYNSEKRAELILEDVPEYHSTLKQLQNQSNIYALLATDKALPLLKYIFKPSWHNALTTSFGQFQTIYPIGVQLFGLEGHFLMTLSANYNELRTGVSNELEQELDAELIIAPRVVDANNGQQYVFTQDANHRVYLLDKGERNLWQKPIVVDGVVNSTIFQVDYRNNETIQYAFSTSKSIYVLDQSGAILIQLPLTSKAATGMLSVDYGKGPRFFVPCVNGNIYGYEQTGKPLSGWQPLAKVGRINTPMQCMNYQDKNYFVTVNQTSGVCKAYRRNGTAYFTNARLGRNITGWGVDPMIGRIAAGSANGKIRVVNKLGKGFGLGAVKGMTKDVQFVYADVIGDGRKDYIRIDDKQMVIHYYAKEKNAKGKEKDVIKSTEPYLFEQSTKRIAFPVEVGKNKKAYIGIHEPKEARIALLNAKGELFKEKSLTGTSTFDVIQLSDEQKVGLVVSNRNRINIYEVALQE